MERKNDRKIVQRVCEGDAEAFGSLVERYSEPIHALVLRMTRDEDLAAEITQESFIRAYERLATFRGESSFSSWLYRIAYNRTLSECRRRRFDRLTPRQEAIADSDGEDSADEQLLGQMRRALERLSTEGRALVTLFYEEERSVAEIAAITGMTQTNVKVKLHRMRKLIRQYMEG